MRVDDFLQDETTESRLLHQKTPIDAQPDGPQHLCGASASIKKDLACKYDMQHGGRRPFSSSMIVARSFVTRCPQSGCAGRLAASGAGTAKASAGSSASWLGVTRGQSWPPFGSGSSPRGFGYGSTAVHGHVPPCCPTGPRRDQTFHSPAPHWRSASGSRQRCRPVPLTVPPDARQGSSNG
jgi:hypothetical protein